MPHMKTKDTAEIRMRIKKAFPEFKFSITTEHGTSLNIIILQGTIDFLEDKEFTSLSINPFWYKDHYKDKPEIIDFMDKILAIIEDVCPKREAFYDPDYGSVPNYYLNISVGTYCKKYIYKGKNNENNN